MGTRKQALILLTDALQAIQTAAELLQKEGHEDGAHARIMELEADLASYKAKLSRPKGKGGKPIKRSDFEQLVKDKAKEVPPAPKQTKVQEQIHEKRGTKAQPEVFFSEGDSLGSIMMRGATRQEERKEKAAAKRRKY